MLANKSLATGSALPINWGHLTSTAVGATAIAAAAAPHSAYALEPETTTFVMDLLNNPVAAGVSLMTAAAWSGFTLGQRTNGNEGAKIGSGLGVLLTAVGAFDDRQEVQGEHADVTSDQCGVSSLRDAFELRFASNPGIGAKQLHGNGQNDNSKHASQHSRPASS